MCYTIFLNSQTAYHSSLSLYHQCIILCFLNSQTTYYSPMSLSSVYYTMFLNCQTTYYSPMSLSSVCYTMFLNSQTTYYYLMSIICVSYHVFKQPDYLLQPNVSLSSVCYTMFLNSQTTYYSPISLYHLCIMPCFLTAKLLTTAQCLSIISVLHHVFEQPNYLLQPNVSLSSVCYTMFLNSQTTYYSPMSLYHQCIMPCFWSAKLLTTAQCLSIICVLYHVFQQPNYLLQSNVSLSSVYHAMFLISQTTYYSPMSLYHLCVMPCFWTAKLLTTAQCLSIICVSYHVFEQPNYWLQPNVSLSSVYFFHLYFCITFAVIQ